MPRGVQLSLYFLGLYSEVVAFKQSAPPSKKYRKGDRDRITTCLAGSGVASVTQDETLPVMG